MATKAKRLTATFQQPSAANRAFSWLQNRGYMSYEINVRISDKSRVSLDDDEDGPSEIPASNLVVAGETVLGVAPHSNDDAKQIRKYFEEQKADNIVYT